MPRHSMICAMALVANLTARSVPADEPKPVAKSPPNVSQAAEPSQAKAAGAALSKRLTYAVQYGSPKDLAAVLEKHFQGEAEFLSLPEPANHSLLIATTPAVFDEVVKTLGLLDRPPQKVIVDVLIVEVQSPPEGHGLGDTTGATTKGFDDRQLAGPFEQVAKGLEALSKQNALSYYRQMRVELLENREGTVQVGEEKPRVNGYIPTGQSGLATPVIQQRAVGTIITVTPRVVDAHKVLLELVVRDDRLGLPEDGLQLAMGVAIMAPDVFTTHLKATLTVPVGQAVIANRVETDARSKRSRQHIIIAARIVEPPTPQAK
jgi:type II secretory pathway component GspD/PulD (secretin)